MKNIKIYYQQVKYQDIHEVFNQFECQITKEINDATIVWTKPQKPQFFKDLKPEQLCNQFPGVELYDDKINLFKSLSLIEAPYIPQTWEFRKDIPLFRKLKHNDDYYIVKPTRQSCGREILIFKGFQVQQDESVDNQSTDVLEDVYPSVCQEYLRFPLLLDGKKFDFRFYVLIYKQHVYLYKEYLLRICRLPYSIGDLSIKIHVTNTSINHIKMSSRQWKQNNQLNNLYMEETLLAQVKTIVKDVYNSINPQIVKKYGNIQENLFTILGFDIILAKQNHNISEERFKAFLLEVNKSPSLLMENEADKDVKPQLLQDTLRLLIHNELGQYIQVI